MVGAQFKKRGRDDGPKAKTTRPSKKLKKQLAAYHSSSSSSDSEGEGGGDDDDDDTFQAVNLLESDEDDIHNALADDGADSDDGAAASSAGSDGDAHAEAAAAARPNKKKTAPAPRPITAKKAAPKSKLAEKDAPSEEEEEEGEDGQDSEADDDDDDELDENDEYSDLDDDEQEEDSGKAARKPKSKSKRADPDAFATSLSKILATKLSATRRADPVLARSAEAQQASRRALDAALEAKARKKLRDQKRLALEKGSVRDVLAPTPGQTTAEILERERRLRKVAQRGVVQLFNAFRTAQVKAAEAERATKKAGVVGMDRKKEKVTEMSKKGFLDLIAAGGGGLKKGPLEEA